MSARNYVPITAAQARKRYEAGQPIAAAGDRAWFTDEYAPDTVTTWFTAASLGLPFDQILPSRGGSFARPVDPIVTLTRGQLAALTTLHEHGILYASVAATNTSTPRTTAATRAALVEAGVAREADPGEAGTALLPVLAPWADGYGAWHVSVPHHIVNDAAVARAVIRGEVMARGGARDYAPGVEYAPGAPAGFTYYREV